MSRERQRRQRSDDPMTGGEDLERASQEESTKYLLKLYITGMTERSKRAIESIREVCETYLSGRYDLEVVDITRHAQLAADEQIIAAPTLIKKLPLPLRRLVGDLSNTDRVLLGLDLRRRDGDPED